MALKVTSAIQLGLIEPELAAIMPTTCEVCETELCVSESIVHLFCDNRMCMTKVAARLEAMAKMMKADGWGESTCRQTVTAFHMASPYQVFLLESKQNTDIPAFEKKLREICDPSKRTKYLWEVVKLANIPHIDTIAFKIFDGYDTLEDAFIDIENLGVSFIADKLGLKNSESGVMALSVYNTLLEYKDELMFGETQFEITRPTGERLRIAITGGVYGFTNKSEFIDYINSRYNGQVNAMQMNTVTRETNVLVADGDTNSSKYTKAVNMANKGHKILITTGKELITYLDGKYKQSQA